MTSLGIHLLVELDDCEPELLNNIDFVRTAMFEAARKANATVVTEAFHQFSPFGISGVVVIAESHLSIHTYPEYNYAAVDVFTCGNTLKPEIAVEYLIEAFKSKYNSVERVDRGTSYKTKER